MNNFNYRNDIMPFAIMLYLMMSMGQLHANQKSYPATDYAGLAGKFVHSVEWYMAETTRSQEGQMFFLYPGP